MEPVEREGAEGDEPEYTPTLEDLRLWEVYRYWVHANPGTHLDVRIGDNTACQVGWSDLAVMPSRRYNAPIGKVGRRFVETIWVELRGVRDRQ